MTIDDDTPDSSRDEEDIEILQNVRDVLARAGVTDITGIGPVSPDRASVRVTVSDKNAAAVPGEVQVKLSNDATVTVKLVMAQADKPVMLYGGPVPQPLQYSGPLMGGDPIWNDIASQGGTITFAAGPGSPVEIEGKGCAEHCVTCSHVLDFGAAVSVSTPKYPSSMTVSWNMAPPSNGKWIDIASAAIHPGTAYKPLEVRGLGVIRGVRQPRTGIRVSKYGAKTGLTSGRDLGWVHLKFPDLKFYWVRKVSGYFCDLGDSGAPVMDARRNLVGMIVSGHRGIADENYYIQVLPKGQLPLPKVPAASIPVLSCFEIDGL